MSLKRISALAFRILIQFIRDKRTLALLFLVPSAVMGLLGYVLTHEVEDIKVAVVDDDRGIGPRGLSVSIAELFVPILEKDPSFVVTEVSSSRADTLQQEGEVEAIIRFGPEFTKNLTEGKPVTLDLSLEGSDPQLNAVITRDLQKDLVKLTESLKNLGTQFRLPALGRAGAPIRIKTSYQFGGPDFEVIDYFAPVYIAFFAFFFVFLLTSVSFLRERSQGTMERLLASPLKKTEIVTGYLAGFILFAFTQSLIILLFAVYALKIHYVGDLFLVLVVEVLLTLGAVNLGIFLSAFARNELQVIQFIPLVIIPQFLIAGVVWPIEALPRLVRISAYAMPLTYANAALRDVMIKGFGILEIGEELLILIIFAVSMMVLATLTLHRETG